MVPRAAGRVCAAGVDGSGDFILHGPGGGPRGREATGVHGDGLATQVQRGGPGAFPHLFGEAGLGSRGRGGTLRSCPAVADQDGRGLTQGSGFRRPLWSQSYSLNLLKDENIMSLFFLLPSMESNAIKFTTHKVRPFGQQLEISQAVRIPWTGQRPACPHCLLFSHLV